MKVKYTIEPAWTHRNWSDVVEIDDEEVKDLSDEEREKHVTEVLTDVINDMCPWGWEEVE
jgi:hypothetical protein